MTIKGIVIDPGHGGADPGAIGNGIYEKDYTLKISNYIYNRLNNLGIPVTLTRDTDITLTPTERVNKAMSAYGNGEDVIVISNHLNAGGGDGAEVIYALRNNSTLSNLILNEIAKTGQNIRSVYQRRSTTDPTKDYYFMQRNTADAETVTVEYGFLDSTKDDPNQIKNNWEALAEATVQGILQYIGYNENKPQETNTYTVKAGDTLYSIANKYGMTVDELKRINNLNNNILTIGQVLKITYHDDSEPSEIDFYIVKAGDTLYSIARELNISLNDLMNYNNLTTTLLSIGQVIQIPKQNQSNTYIVKAGDTLYSIARDLGISADEIMILNNLDSTTLQIGQILKVPNQNTNNIYVVKSGDTLYSIAKKYNTNVDRLKEMNNLQNNLLSIGQTINVP